MLINKSTDKVLVVDGEELVGAKQNRIVKASFLIASHAKVVIPPGTDPKGPREALRPWDWART